MTILECGDATDVESVLDVVYSTPGPVYVRYASSGRNSRLFSSTDKMRLGSNRVISRGDDIALFTSGICTEEAMRVTRVEKTRFGSVKSYPYNHFETV